MHPETKKNTKHVRQKIKSYKPGLVASYDMQPGNGAGLF